MGDVLRFPVERRFQQMQLDAELQQIDPVFGAPRAPENEQAVLFVGASPGFTTEVSATFMGAPIPVVHADGNGVALRLRPPPA